MRPTVATPRMEAGPGKDLGDLYLSQHRTEGLQLLDHVPNKVRILVHRLRQLDQGIRTLLDHAFEPGGDGFGRYEECLGCLLQGPIAGCPKLKDSHSLGRRVIWSSMRRQLCHAGLMDAELLTEQGDLLMGAVKIGFQANSGVGAIGRPAPSVGHGELGQADHLQDRRLDPGGPASR
jgi:hypothetical protein